VRAIEHLPRGRAVRDLLTDYSDWWVAGADDRLTLLSHEAGLTKRTTDLGAGALFLTRALEVLESP
jgi:hypothetical protein